MTEKKDDVFRAAMGDVAPLHVEQRVALAKQKQDAEILQRRRAAAEAEIASRTEALTGSFVTPVGPHDIISFKRSGIQQGVFKNLRLGKYPIDAQLDLHRLTVEEARSAVAQFVKDCVAHDVRCAMVNHGKGENRQPQPALLKSCIAHWLPQLDEVMALHSAVKQHGGVGATYVLLKKSERKRLDNLEKHQRRPIG